MPFSRLAATAAVGFFSPALADMRGTAGRLQRERRFPAILAGEIETCAGRRERDPRRRSSLSIEGAGRSRGTHPALA
jgi:hypothetical protein